MTGPFWLALTLALALAPADQDATLDAARKLRRAGDLPAAAAELRRGLVSHPGDAELEGLLGSVLLESGEIGEARRLAEAHRGSDSYRAQVLVGQVLQRDGDADGALAAFRRAADLKERPLEALRGQIDVFVAQGLHGRALKRAEQLNALAPHLGGPELARVYGAQGDQIMGQGAEMLAVAIGRYQLARQHAPEDRDLARRLLEALVISTRLESARALIGELWGDESAEAAYWSGRCHDAAREVTPARAAFRRAYELDPSDARPALHLARLALADDLHAEARQWLAIARERLPDTARSLVLAADLAASLGDLEQAERNLRRATAIEPRNAGALYQLARILLRQGKREEGAAAMAAFRELQQAQQPPVEER